MYTYRPPIRPVIPNKRALREVIPLSTRKEQENLLICLPSVYHVIALFMQMRPNYRFNAEMREEWSAIREIHATDPVEAFRRLNLMVGRYLPMARMNIYCVVFEERTIVERVTIALGAEKGKK